MNVVRLDAALAAEFLDESGKPRAAGTVVTNPDLALTLGKVRLEADKGFYKGEIANRLAAYVLSLTPRWRAEWGGLLEFIGADGHIAAGYVPNFNSLRLFRVPINHHVSCVAPFAMAGRYSITGWLRAR